MVELSEEQRLVFEQILLWLDSPRQRLTIGGLAGTGKSTLISRLLADPHLAQQDVCVCAFTGKAAQVLRSKGIEDAQTMHSLIYQPSTTCKSCGVSVTDEDPIVQRYCQTAFRRQQQLHADLVVVDEASMLSSRLVDDLESYGIKVLYVGDHGQLEPIGDNPGLMVNPDLRLETIHRQAADSAIIRFAHAVRGSYAPERHIGYAKGEIRIASYDDLDAPEEYDAVLCGFNRTRCILNQRIRDARGYDGDVQTGETVICLQNNKEQGVFNGQRFTVTDVSEDSGGLVLGLRDEGGAPFQNVPVSDEAWGRERVEQRRRSRVLMDFGYAITAHKSQGSEFDRVAVVEELHPSWTASRWRYTAATRAAKELHYYV